MKQTDCSIVWDTTEQMAEAIRREDMALLGLAIEKRQACLERLALPGTDISLADKALLVRAMALDKQVCADAQALLAQYQKDIGQYEAKVKGLLRYESHQLNLSQGQLMDRKR
ncbi:MAG: hypothetical protein ABF904_03965 [Ethanoligenens sp.]